MIQGIKAIGFLWMMLLPLRWLWWHGGRKCWRGILLPVVALFESKTLARLIARNNLDLAFLEALTMGRFFNELMCSLSYWLKLPISLGKVSYAIIELSNCCNLKCPLCTTGGLKKANPNIKRGMMSLDCFKTCINKLLPCLRYLELYTWGEPLLNNDVCSCIRYATDRRIVTQISTNMQIYTEDIGNKLIESGLKKIIVSCDGLTQSTYERYRVGGNLNKLERSVKHLIQTKKEKQSKYPIIEIQFIVFKHNEHEMEAFREHWLSIGVDNVHFIAMSFMSKMGKELAVRDGFVPSSPQWAPFQPYGKLRTCALLYDHISVNWNGDIYTCCFPCGDETYKLGNLQEDDIARIWNGKVYRYCRRLLKRHKADSEEWSNTMCHDCVGVFPSLSAKRYWS